jgi:hypothetical protein
MDLGNRASSFQLIESIKDPTGCFSFEVLKAIPFNYSPTHIPGLFNDAFHTNRTYAVPLYMVYKFIFLKRLAL